MTLTLLTPWTQNSPTRDKTHSPVSSLATKRRLGHPEDNGGHERMHLDMRYELEDCAEADFTAQQKACELWRKDFNYVRPHEALAMATPAEVYRPSPRIYGGSRKAEYPLLMQIPVLASAAVVEGQYKNPTLSLQDLVQLTQRNPS